MVIYLETGCPDHWTQTSVSNMVSRCEMRYRIVVNPYNRRGRMKRILFGLFVVTLMVAGCGKQVPVTVTNDLDIWDIDEVYIYEGSDKGENLMAETCVPGTSGEITVAPGTYNILAIDDEAGEYSWSGVVVGDEGYTLHVTPADRDGFEETIEIGAGEYFTGEGDAVVSITNDLDDWTIWWVYVVEEDEGFWDDRLQTYFLYPGETINILVDPGVYDIQVEDEDGDTYTLWGVDVSDDYDWDVTLDNLDAYDYTYGSGEGICPVDIYNGLDDWTIWYILVDPSDEPWGEDRLGAEILEPGELFTVWVDPGTWDIQVEDEDGDTYTLWDVEIDEAGYYWEVTLADID